MQQAQHTGHTRDTVMMEMTIAMHAVATGCLQMIIFGLYLAYQTVQIRRSMSAIAGVCTVIVCTMTPAVWI